MWVRAWLSSGSGRKERRRDDGERNPPPSAPLPCCAAGRLPVQLPPGCGRDCGGADGRSAWRDGRGLGVMEVAGLGLGLALALGLGCVREQAGGSQPGRQRCVLGAVVREQRVEVAHCACSEPPQCCWGAGRAVEGSGVFHFMRCLQGVVGGDARTPFLLTPGPQQHFSVQQSLSSAAVIVYYSTVPASSYLNLGI